MSRSLETDGYKIQRQLLDPASIRQLRIEADDIAREAGSACVRHLRQRSPVMDRLGQSEAFLALLPMGMRPVRSILFDKTESENWPVAWHQDLTIALAERQELPGYGPWSKKNEVAHVQPPTALLDGMVTIRLHLDDTPASNGALRVIPGSHRRGKISPDELPDHDTDEAIDCECLAGDALMMKPLILHSSRRAAHPTRRRVLHFEYAQPESLHPDLAWFEGMG